MTRLNISMLDDIKAYAECHTVKETAEKFSVPYQNMVGYMVRHKIKRMPRKTRGKDNNNYKVGFAMNKKLYWVYYAMLQRCYHKNCSRYSRYGGRGIAVCDEWRNDNTAFYQWALTNGYKEGLTLDRIDNDKGYSPDNCRWVSVKTQNNNTSKCVYITYNGETHTMQEWANITGINYSCLRNRHQRGESIERLLSKERLPRRRKI